MKRLIRLDWACKKILRDKANFEILEGFLSELLRTDITIENILESEANQEHHRDKFNRVDLLVKDANQQLILIEIQNQTQLDYLQRILFAQAKLIVDHMKLGDAYHTIKKIISVNILYFDLGQGEDYLYHGSTKYVGMHLHDTLELSVPQQQQFGKAAVSDLLPESYLIKVGKFRDVITERLDEWIYFLKHEQVRPDSGAKGLLAAQDKLDVLRMNESERLEYDRYVDDLRYQASMFDSSFGQGYRKGQEEGRIEGKIEGEQSTKRTIALHMKKSGLSTAEIIRFTGLTVHEVEKLPQ